MALRPADADPWPADISAIGGQEAKPSSAGPPRRRVRAKHRVKATAVLAALALAVLAVALWRSDPRAAARQLAGVPPLGVAAVVGLVLLAYALRFAKWQLFLHRLGAKVPLGRSAAVFTSGLLMVVTPAKVGEVWKAFALQETDGIPVARTLGAVALDRITDVLALAALALLAAAALGLAPWLAALALVAFAAGVALLRWRRPWLALLARLEARKPGTRAVAFLHALYLDTASLLSPSTLGAGSALALAAWALEGLALWAILLGLGAPAGAPWAVGVFAAGSLAGGLSVLPGGVGTAEAGMVALLVAGGVDSPTAFAATLLVRLLTLGFGAALGAVCYLGWTLRRRGKAPPHLKQAAA